MYYVRLLGPLWLFITTEYVGDRHDEKVGKSLEALNEYCDNVVSAKQRDMR